MANNSIPGGRRSDTTGWIGPNFSKEMAFKWGMLSGFFFGVAAATILWKIIL